mgnify:CR=1 FL=1
MRIGTYVIVKTTSESPTRRIAKAHYQLKVFLKNMTDKNSENVPTSTSVTDETRKFLSYFLDTRFCFYDDSKGSLPAKESREYTPTNIPVGYGHFFSVNGIRTVSGRAFLRDKENVSTLNAIWCDIDGIPTIEQPEHRNRLFEKLLEIDVLPTFVVASKNGPHLYWLFERPVHATEELKIRQEELLKDIAFFLNGDPSVAECSHVLRVPGSLHMKEPNDPFLVKIVSSKPEIKYTMETLTQRIPKRPTARDKTMEDHARKKIEYPLSVINRANKIYPPMEMPSVKYLMNSPQLEKGFRHAAVLYLTQKLIHAGLLGSQIIAHFVTHGAFGLEKEKGREKEYEKVVFDLINNKRKYDFGYNSIIYEHLSSLPELNTDIIAEERQWRAAIAGAFAEAEVEEKAKKNAMLKEKTPLSLAINHIRANQNSTQKEVKTILRKVFPNFEEKEFDAVWAEARNITGLEKLAEKEKKASQPEDKSKAEILMFHHNFAKSHPNLLFEKNSDSTFWDYEPKEGIYEEKAHSTIVESLARDLEQAKLLDLVSPNVIRMKMMSFKGMYLDRARTLRDFNNKPGLFPVKNGILDLKNNVLLPFDASKLFLSKSPVIYDPNAQCPLWKKFLNEALEGDQGQIRLMQQFGGYFISGDPKFQKSLVMKGQPGSGKSTAAQIFINLVGKENTSHLTAEGFNTPHGTETLVGKRLNWTNEVKPAFTSMNEMVKYISGEPMILNRKNRPVTSFTPSGMQIWSVNDLPSSLEIGIFRRLIIVPFNVQFVKVESEDPEREVAPKEGEEEQKEDPELLEKLSAEMSGILNWALEGLVDLNKTGHFTTTRKNDERLTEYREVSDNVYAFIHEAFDAGDSWFKSSDLYNMYKEWCGRNGCKEKSNNSFGMSLGGLPKPYKVKKAERAPHKTRGWEGLSLKSSYVSDMNDFLDYTPPIEEVKSESPVENKVESVIDITPPKFKAVERPIENTVENKTEDTGGEKSDDDFIKDIVDRF